MIYDSEIMCLVYVYAADESLLIAARGLRVLVKTVWNFSGTIFCYLLFYLRGRFKGDSQLSKTLSTYSF